MKHWDGDAMVSLMRGLATTDVISKGQDDVYDILLHVSTMVAWCVPI